jgi:cytochrome c oxidase subunit IV
VLTSSFYTDLAPSENISQHTVELVLKHWYFLFKYCLSVLAKNVDYA